MPKKALLFVACIALCLIVFFLFIKDSEGNHISPPFTSYSRSIAESKEKGAFQFELVADTNKLILDGTHKIKLKSAWLENVWTEHVYVIGKTAIEKHDWYQLILIYDILKTDTVHAPDLYYFLGGRIMSGSLTYYNCDKKDTIKVPLFKQTSPHLPSSDKRKAYDSIMFVRRYNT